MRKTDRRLRRLDALDASIPSSGERAKIIDHAVLATISDRDVAVLAWDGSDHSYETAQVPTKDERRQAERRLAALRREYSRVQSLEEALAVYGRHRPEVLNMDDPTLRALKALAVVGGGSK